MYVNVETEMIRVRVTRRTMADALHLTYGTLCKKLNGSSDLTLGEALSIKEMLETDMTIEKLFEKSVEA